MPNRALIQNMIRVMFMGTPDFSVQSFEALFAHKDCNVVCAVTNPDRPKGRGHKKVHPPVYNAAEKHGIKIYQPENLKKENFETILNTEKPDLIVVVAFGMFLPQYVLDFPKYGCINVHASLLPKYRGAAPMQWCIINGEKKTGVTTMYMAKGIDTGDILLKDETQIADDDTFETIHNRLMVMGAKLLCKTVDALLDGSAVRIPQDESESSYVSVINKADSVINWNKNAYSIHNLVRGLYPYPKAVTSYMGTRIKIEKTEACDMRHNEKGGTVTDVDKNSFTVACADNTALKVLVIQPEGKKSMPVSAYLLGNSVKLNTKLGDD